MPLVFRNTEDFKWTLRKIAVVGPGIVGMPMAAMLANARIRIGTAEPAKVVVIQRNSKTSGWKVPAINRGESVIGGVEPGLDAITKDAVDAGILSASHDYGALADADMILVSIQTDKKGMGPDYGPLFEGLEGIAAALVRRPAGNIPVIVFESTLAPSSMQTVIRDLFARHGLVEGRDVLLGNSPNRVMPGRLVERVAESDKLVAGLHPLTPQLIKQVYSHIVTKGELHATSSMAAEVVKTLENAYRDVRIAYAAEVVRYCDANDISFYAVRDAVNERLAQTDGASASATAVPRGGILVPTLGVGGHCLPKDGILLWWRRIESGAATANSLILESRKINDASPADVLALAEKTTGRLTSGKVALLGIAYRFDSEDTRNSPTFELARLLAARGCEVSIHDPYVRSQDANLAQRGLTQFFTNDMVAALENASVVFLCTGHGVYAQSVPSAIAARPQMRAFVDAANVFKASDFAGNAPPYVGLGRGRNQPMPEFLDFVEQSFRAVEHGVGNEVNALLAFLNAGYAADSFNRVSLEEVQQLAGTCPTGCAIADVKNDIEAPSYRGFSSHLARCAMAASS